MIINGIIIPPIRNKLAKIMTLNSVPFVRQHSKARQSTTSAAIRVTWLISQPRDACSMAVIGCLRGHWGSNTRAL